MQKKEMIAYWQDTADKDYQTLRNLYESKDYPWCFIVGYVVIEKLLKVMFVEKVAINPPRELDLLRLAERLKLDLSDEQKDVLDTVTVFYSNVQHPDYKQDIYEECTEEFTQEYMQKMKEVRSWLLKELGQK